MQGFPKWQKRALFLFFQSYRGKATRLKYLIANCFDTVLLKSNEQNAVIWTKYVWLCRPRVILLLRAHPRGWIFLCAQPFSLPPQGQSYSVFEEIWHVCWESVCKGGKLLRGRRGGVGNVSFRWWRKLECPERTTGQPQVTDNFLTYG